MESGAVRAYPHITGKLSLCTFTQIRGLAGAARDAKTIRQHLEESFHVKATISDTI